MMETSLNVYDYPTPPEEKTKTIKGRLYLTYKFEMEVPDDWEICDIKQNVYENVNDYQQDLDDIEIDV